MYVSHAVRNYNAEAKQQYRRWLVETARALTGWYSVPAGLQYWTTQGAMTRADGQLYIGAEPIQLMESDFIRSEQFYAVECNPATHLANQELLLLYPDAHLFYGAIDIVMGQLAKEGRFKPGIVALDTNSEPNLATRLLAHVNHHALKKVDGPVVVFLNVVLKGRYRKHSPADLFQAFRRLDAVHSMLRYEGWVLGENGYRYRGVSRRSTEMLTVCMHRGLDIKARKTDDLQITENTRRAV